MKLLPFGALVIGQAIASTVSEQMSEAQLIIAQSNSSDLFTDITTSFVVPTVTEGDWEGPWEMWMGLSVQGNKFSSGVGPGLALWGLQAGLLYTLALNGTITLQPYYHVYHEDDADEEGLQYPDGLDIDVGDELQVTFTRTSLTLGSLVYENLSNGGQLNLTISNKYSTSADHFYASWGLFQYQKPNPIDGEFYVMWPSPNFGNVTLENCAAKLTMSKLNVQGTATNYYLAGSTTYDLGYSSTELAIKTTLLDENTVQLQYLTDIDNYDPDL